MKRRIIVAGVVITAILLGYWLSGGNTITFANFKACAHSLRCFVNAHYVPAVVAFCSFYILSIAFSMPWAAVMTLAAGYMFGMFGMVYVLASGLIGGTIAFLLARYVLGDYIQRRWGKHVQQFNEEVDEHGGMYLFVIRLIPVFPFCIVNSLAGLTTIGLRVFWVSTLFGMIPTTAIFTYAGTRLAYLSCVWDVFSWPIVLSLGGIAAFALLVLQLKRMLRPRV